MLPSRLWRRRLSAGTSRRKLSCKAGWYHVSPDLIRVCHTMQPSSPPTSRSLCGRRPPDVFDLEETAGSQAAVATPPSAARAHSSLKSPPESPRERSAETSAVHERFTVSGGGGVVATAVSGTRCECFAYRRNSDETPSVSPVKCASTPPLFDNCIRSLVLACGVMTMSRQAGLGLADLLVKTSTTSPCCNS